MYVGDLASKAWLYSSSSEFIYSISFVLLRGVIDIFHGNLIVGNMYLTCSEQSIELLQGGWGAGKL